MTLLVIVPIVLTGAALFVAWFRPVAPGQYSGLRILASYAIAAAFSLVVWLVYAAILLMEKT